MTDYATFGQRLVAMLVDWLWMIPLGIALSFILYGEQITTGEIEPRLGAELVTWLLPAVIIVSFWNSRRATPGKMALKLEVVDAETGGTPPVGRLILRYIGYFLSSFVFGLGYLWMLWDARRQTWHDKIARTVVVRRSGVALPGPSRGGSV
ncbi:MAG: RDD family protein [Geminicoccaceae bacterium]|nr:RDD family protein [Geminicoccaceae bacterium]